MARKGDYTLHNYQDDLDTDPRQTDPVMDERADDITKELNIPENEMKDELDKVDPDKSDDALENVEDIDEEEGRLRS